jgi:hypothetical protein
VDQETEKKPTQGSQDLNQSQTGQQRQRHDRSIRARICAVLTAFRGWEKGGNITPREGSRFLEPADIVLGTKEPHKKKKLQAHDPGAAR